MGRVLAAVHWRRILYYLVGGVVSLAAIADAEKAVADNTRSNGENIRCLIISPVNIQTILTVDFLHFQHSSYFIVIE
ncbi:hypothetical protein IN67_21495 [Salmonella enterica]|uniref:Uncharacterized protein n=1 Tax=Salmonella enterica I TaxID=59201 RepID=A0A379UMH8_SALET|nr:hypothetical protein IN67_21495 [Salmonella enterica]OSJ55530.1 hypothetical protein K791_01300 [Salmonella enterica subsp. enterica serovar Newport str. SHSN001]OXX98117.1 hypothetical protein P701_07345 [Salmonella enterica subsp. enterica serovar Newport str. CVM80_2288]CUR90214.1 Uncharacterised protein [Salmonella enterica subsp. enterica serovar Weltevreden]SUG69544.1 Uncharacterised protein [Salmonella enterica subsp. enterica]